MNALSENRPIAERYATDFIRQLHLGNHAEQKCEWSCILWSRDHWAEQARRAKIELHQAKDRISVSPGGPETAETLFTNSEFLNTVAQVYSKLFNSEQKTCNVKIFNKCPFIEERPDLLSRGSMASVFITVLHKATFYAMLDRHPLDSGLIEEEYRDVYGVDLTDFRDLEISLTDGRFEKLYAAVVKRAAELAGLAKGEPKDAQPV
jgi:hypothetical protein